MLRTSNDCYKEAKTVQQKVNKIAEHLVRLECEQVGHVFNPSTPCTGIEWSSSGPQLEIICKRTCKACGYVEVIIVRKRCRKLRKFLRC